MGFKRSPRHCSPAVFLPLSLSLSTRFHEVVYFAFCGEECPEEFLHSLRSLLSFWSTVFFLSELSFTRVYLRWVKVDQILDQIVTQVQIDYPVHELEAGEWDGENHTAVLVNVRCRHAKHLVQLLHVALGIWRGRTGGRTRGTRRAWGWARVRPTAGGAVIGWPVIRAVAAVRSRWRRGRGLLVVTRPASPPVPHSWRWHSSVRRWKSVLVTAVVVARYCVLSGPALTVHLGVVYLEMNRLEDKRQTKKSSVGEMAAIVDRTASEAVAAAAALAAIDWFAAEIVLLTMHQQLLPILRR